MNGTTLSLGSLFSGIGGLELGLEMTGRFKTVWQVEQSEYCRKVLRKHWPDAIQFEDVKDVGKENLPAVDVICGGFPCQDISSAGRRAGIVEGNRSGLWHEYVRIIRELRPQYVIVENVSALLVRGLDVVLGELAESGYDAEWSMLSAADVGAPHLRQRIFVIAHASSERPLVEPQRIGRRSNAPESHRHGANGSVADSNGGRCEQRDETERGVSVINAPSPAMAYAERERLQGGSDPRGCEEMGIPRREPLRGRGKVRHTWKVEPDVGRVAHGVSRRVDRLRALGNAVVPQCAQVIGEWLLEIDAELNHEGAA